MVHSVQPEAKSRLGRNDQLVRKVSVLEGLDSFVVNGVELAFAEWVKSLPGQGELMDPVLLFEKQ